METIKTGVKLWKREEKKENEQKNEVNCLRDYNECVVASDLMEFTVNKCWICRKICLKRKKDNLTNKMDCALTETSIFVVVAIHFRVKRRK